MEGRRGKDRVRIPVYTLFWGVLTLCTEDSIKHLVRGLSTKGTFVLQMFQTTTSMTPHYIGRDWCELNFKTSESTVAVDKTGLLGDQLKISTSEYLAIRNLIFPWLDFQYFWWTGSGFLPSGDPGDLSEKKRQGIRVRSNTYPQLFGR